MLNTYPHLPHPHPHHRVAFSRTQRDVITSPPPRRGRRRSLRKGNGVGRRRALTSAPSRCRERERERDSMCVCVCLEWLLRCRSPAHALPTCPRRRNFQEILQLLGLQFDFQRRKLSDPSGARHHYFCFSSNSRNRLPPPPSPPPPSRKTASFLPQPPGKRAGMIGRRRLGTASPGAKQAAWCRKTGRLLISARLLHSFESGSAITSSH